MKNSKFYFLLIGLFLNVDLILSQGFSAPTNYFQTTPGYIDLFVPSPAPTNPHGAILYFDLSQISSEEPDIAVVQNFKEIVSFPNYNFNKHGNWNENLDGSGNFDEQSENPFFPTEFFYGNFELDNPFNSTYFVKLRNSDKKDLVALRKNNLYVFRNESNTLSQQVQNIASGGTYMDIGNFTSGDNNDDVGIVDANGVTKVYRNDLTGILTALNPSPNLVAKIIKIGQINDRTYPYPQINANDRSEIITTSSLSQNINIYQNNNNNTVTLSNQIGVGFYINDLAVADVNRDGFNDLIVISQSSANLKVFVNNGEGAINTSAIYSSTPSQIFNGLISISDLNNDGFNDIVVVGIEGQTSVYINTTSGNYFSQTPNQTISQLAGYQSTNSQTKIVDIYNQGGKALFIAWNGTGQVPNSARGISRVNATSFNWPPPPPLIAAATQQIGMYTRPKIRMISNFDTPDFLKYEVYKANDASGYNFNYCGETTGNEYVDNTEEIIISEGPEEFAPNCYYIVKTVDLTSYRSAPSNELAYQVGDPTCPSCMDEGGDNIVQSNTQIETKFYSLSNFPNPFNPSTTISFEIPDEDFINLKIYNISGEEIVTLIHEVKAAGKHSVTFNGNNLSSGVYFYQLKTGDFTQTKRMLLTK